MGDHIVITGRIALTSLNPANCDNANTQIKLNLGIPTLDGKTQDWCPTRQASGESFYFILAPEETGWNGHSFEEAMAGVEGMTQQPYDTNWVPAIPID